MSTHHMVMFWGFHRWLENVLQMSLDVGDGDVYGVKLLQVLLPGEERVMTE